jgi:hypothetical protein
MYGKKLEKLEIDQVNECITENSRMYRHMLFRVHKGSFNIVEDRCNVNLTSKIGSSNQIFLNVS